MIVFVHKAHESLLRWRGPHIGRLLSPRQFSRAADTADAGIPWAADNDCFQGLDPDAYMKMLDAIYGLPGCKFVTAPDVVGDAYHTWELFWEWWDQLRDLGQPIAYVLQDDVVANTVPWDFIAAVFVGGSSEFKCSPHARAVVQEAQAKGLWTHMGRVNTMQRMRLAKSWGIHSIDGTSVSMFTELRLPERIEQAAAPQQLPLEAT